MFQYVVTLLKVRNNLREAKFVGAKSRFYAQEVLYNCSVSLIMLEAEKHI